MVCPTATQTTRTATAVTVPVGRTVLGLLGIITIIRNGSYLRLAFNLLSLKTLLFVQFMI